MCRADQMCPVGPVGGSQRLANPIGTLNLVGMASLVGQHAQARYLEQPRDSRRFDLGLGLGFFGRLNWSLFLTREY